MKFSTDQFDVLLNQAISRLKSDGLDRADILPRQVDFWLEECEETDTLLIDWDALTYKEQTWICDELRDQLYKIEFWQAAEWQACEDTLGWELRYA